MSVPAAYLGVILIWSTTPLGIKWSAEGGGFLFGVTGRMVLGVTLCWLLLAVLRIPFPLHRRAWLTYFIAGTGIYGAMLSVYWGAQQIPSGLVSVVFGLTPIVTGVFATAWLGERHFTAPRLLGVAACIGGLTVIFRSDLAALASARYGVLAVMVSVLLHSISAVGVKRLDEPLPALALTCGALTVAVPAYLLTWWIIDGHWPASLTPRATMAIVYLGVFGSVVGFALYYYALKRLDTGRMALITLVTPLAALYIGWQFNGESLPLGTWLGTLLILAGLGLYLLEARLPRRRQSIAVRRRA